MASVKSEQFFKFSQNLDLQLKKLENPENTVKTDREKAEQ